MKTCSYCGTKYQDSVVECPVDRTPLANQMEPRHSPPVTKTKQEIAMLQEILETYRNCDEKVALSWRKWWGFTLISWGLIFCAFLLGQFEHVNVLVSLTIALLGGGMGGLGLVYASAARTAPLLVRFTTLNEEELTRRLEELRKL